MNQKLLSLYHLSLYSLVDLICCLICLIFLKFPRWPVWTFCAQTTLNFQMKLLKMKIENKIKKYFVAHQEFSEIFDGPSIYANTISWPLFINLSAPSYILNVRPFIRVALQILENF